MAPETEQKAIQYVIENLPKNVNMGCIQANKLAFQTFKIANPSKYAIEVEFSECLFTVRPRNLVIASKKSSEIRVYVYLPEAKIVVGKIKAAVSAQKRRGRTAPKMTIMKFSAIGKFPHVKLSRKQIDFGKVNVGAEVSEMLEVSNVSQVPIDFRIRSYLGQRAENVPESQDVQVYSGKVENNPHITVTPRCGRMYPNQRYELKVKYNPKLFDQHDFAEFLVDVGSKPLDKESLGVKNECIRHWSKEAYCQADKLDLRFSDLGDTPDPNAMFEEPIEGIIAESKIERHFVEQEEQNLEQRMKTMQQVQKTKRFKVSGYCSQFRSRFDTQVLDFGVIVADPSRKKNVRSVTLYNDYDHELEFTFITECSYFKVQHQRGLIKKKSEKVIKIFFKAETPANYFKRLFCVLKGHWLLTLDCFGSVRDYLKTPLPLKMFTEGYGFSLKENISQTTNFFTNGNLSLADTKMTGIQNNDQFLRAKHHNTDNTSNNPLLSVSFRKHEEKQDFHLPKISISGSRLKSINRSREKSMRSNHAKKQRGNLQQIENFERNKYPPFYKGFNLCSTNENLFSQMKRHENLFDSKHKKSDFVKFSERFFMFDLGEQRELKSYFTVTNVSPHYTFGIMLLIKSKEFKVDFKNIELGPREERVVEVIFAPEQKNLFHYANLDVLVTNEKVESIDFDGLGRMGKFRKKKKKRLKKRDRLLGNLKNVKNPELIMFDETIVLLASSFGQLSQPFIPMVEFEPRRVLEFSSKGKGIACFRTLRIKNNTDTNSIFEFLDIPKDFEVFPRQGHIKREDFTTVIIRFNPSSKVDRHEKLICKLNSIQRHTMQIKASVMKPSIDLQNDGRIFFSPSTCGVVNKQPLKVKNLSGLEVGVRCKVPKNGTHEIRFLGLETRLRPYEERSLEVEFVPVKRKKYKVKCILEVYDMEGCHLEKEDKQVLVFGEGGDGPLELWPKKIDFKMVKINFLKKEKIVLHNPSDKKFYVVFCLNEDVRKQRIKSSSTIVSTSGCHKTFSHPNQGGKMQNSKPAEKKGNLEKLNSVYSDLEASMKENINIRNTESKMMRKKSQFVQHNRSKHLKESSIGGQKESMIEGMLGSKRAIIYDYFSLDFTEGIIPAKSRKEINIIFKPRDICQASLRLEVYSRQIVEEPTESQKPRPLVDSMLTGDRSILNESLNPSAVWRNDCGNGSRLVRSAGQGGRDSLGGKESERGLEEDFNVNEKGRHYRLGYVLKGSAQVKVKAHYPLLRFVNIKNNILSVSSLWEKFQISRLNKELAKPLTDFEKKNQLNKIVLFDRLKDEEAADRKFLWDFGYLHNSKRKNPREILTNIQNFGGTELEWRIKMEDDAEFDLNRRGPTSSSGWRSSRNNDSLFEIYPLGGVLQPGERQQILLRYHPRLNDEGYEKNGEKRIEEQHRMKAYMSIMNGKSVEITLMGRTISSIVGKLVMKTPDVTLPRIPTNLVLPVIIPVPLLNIGANSIKFSIDRADFFKRNRISPEKGEIDLDNTQSTLSSMEKKNLLVLFKPREQKTYRFKAKLRVFDFFKEIQSIELTFTGSGSNDSFHSLTRMTELSLPRLGVRRALFSSPVTRTSEKSYSLQTSQKGLDYDFFRSRNYKQSECIIEDTEIFFSSEELEFLGVLPMKTYKKFVYFCNQSKDRHIDFEFANINSVTVKHDDLKMTPTGGSLAPGEIVEINFELTQTGLPSFYEIEIACKICYQKAVERTLMTDNSSPTSERQKTSQRENSKSKKIVNVEERMFLRIRKAPNLDHFTKIYSPEFKQRNPVSAEEDFKEEDLKIGLETLGKSLGEVINTRSLQEMISKMVRQPVDFYGCLDDENDQARKELKRRDKVKLEKKMKFEMGEGFDEVTSNSQILPPSNGMVQKPEENPKEINKILEEDEGDIHMQNVKQFWVEPLDEEAFEFREDQSSEEWWDGYWLGSDEYDWPEVEPSVLAGEPEDEAESKKTSEFNSKSTSKTSKTSKTGKTAKSEKIEPLPSDIEIWDDNSSDKDSIISGSDMSSEPHLIDEDEIPSGQSKSIHTTSNNMSRFNGSSSMRRDIQSVSMSKTKTTNQITKEDNFVQTVRPKEKVEWVKTKTVRLKNRNLEVEMMDLQNKIMMQIIQKNLKSILEDCVHNKLDLRYQSKKIKYWLKSIIRTKMKRMEKNPEISWLIRFLNQRIRRKKFDFANFYG